MRPRDDFATARAVGKDDDDDDDDSLPPPPPRGDVMLPAAKTPESPSAAGAVALLEESSSKLESLPQSGKPPGTLKDRMKAFQSDNKTRNDDAAADASDNPFGRWTNPAQLLASSKPPPAADTTAEVKDAAAVDTTAQAKDAVEDNKVVSSAGIEGRKSVLRQASFSGSMASFSGSIKKLHNDNLEKQGGLKKLGSPFASEDESSQASHAAGHKNLFGRPTAAQLLAGNK